MMKVLVLLNETAGTLAASSTGDEPQRIERAFAAQGVEAQVRAVPAEELQQAAREALSGPIDAVVAGGGDGTLNAVASAMVGSDKALGVLPLGTLNHFAKELGMPAELEEAVEAIVRGSATEMPVGEVNGQVFLSFSALGLYVETIRHREAQRSAKGRHKWVAMVIAMVKQLRRFPLMWVTLRIGGRTLRRLTPSVFLCSNRYQLEALGLGADACGGRDRLSLYIARHTGRLAAVWTILRALTGRLEGTRNLESICVGEVTIHKRRRLAHVAIDGEVIALPTPLHYRVCPARLKVIVPGGDYARV